jgi:hypothetical protein
MGSWAMIDVSSDEQEETSATKGVLDIAKARCTMDDFHIALDKLESATTKKSVRPCQALPHRRLRRPGWGSWFREISMCSQDTSVLNQQLAKMKDMKLVAVVLKEVPNQLWCSRRFFLA